MSCKDGMQSNISTVVAPAVKLDSPLRKELEKTSHKADWMTSVSPLLPPCFVYIQCESQFCLVKRTRSLEESYIPVWSEL